MECILRVHVHVYVGACLICQAGEPNFVSCPFPVHTPPADVTRPHGAARGTRMNHGAAKPGLTHSNPANQEMLRPAQLMLPCGNTANLASVQIDQHGPIPQLPSHLMELPNTLKVGGTPLPPKQGSVRALKQMANRSS